jgi:hypothetical protein
MILRRATDSTNKYQGKIVKQILIDLSVRSRKWNSKGEEDWLVFGVLLNPNQPGLRHICLDEKGLFALHARSKHSEVEHGESENSTRILTSSGFLYCFQIHHMPLISAWNWLSNYLDYFRPDTVSECLDEIG